MKRTHLTRRDLMKYAGLGAVASSGFTLPALSKPRDIRPNILLILCDDMGYSDIGCFGGEIRTPNLDRLAAGGVRFTQFYNTARCCPTRASLMTGLYPHECGLGHMTGRDQGTGYRGFINDSSVTIAEVLAAAGYRTMMTGKWHAGTTKGHWPEDRGFQRFHGIHNWVDSYWKVLRGCEVYEDGKVVTPATADPPNVLQRGREWYSTEVFTDHAIRFIDEAVWAGTPFFQYVAYNAPHWPLEAPDEDIAKYRGTYTSGWRELRRQRYRRMIEMGILKKAWPLSEDDAPKWESLPGTDRDELDFRRSIYAAQIDRMDRNIARLVRRLKDRGVYENTLILFLSDNGCSAEPEDEMFGYKFATNRIANFAAWRKESGRSASQGRAWANASNTPFRLFKKWSHEGGVSTPLIAHWPAGIRRPGRMDHQPGHVVDILATCVDVAGATYPKAHKGKTIKPARGISLLPTLQDRDRPPHDAIYWEHQNSAAIRMGTWKLVCENVPAGRPWELYDMAADRTETNDLAAKHADRVATMKEAWLAWARETNVLPFPAQRAKGKRK